MTTALVDLDPNTTADFDLDAEISVAVMSTEPAITSASICTPGCTSLGTGSFCSFCCC